MASGGSAVTVLLAPNRGGLIVSTFNEVGAVLNGATVSLDATPGSFACTDGGSVDVLD